MSNAVPEFQIAADELGLGERPSGSPTVLLRGGVLDGVEVTLEGAADGGEIRAAFDPPLDLRLSLGVAGVKAKLAGLFGVHDVEAGDRPFDDAFEIKADEPARAQAILVPEVRAALLAWKTRGDGVALTDRAIVVTTSISTAAEIVDTVRGVVALAKRVAATPIPPSAILAPHAEAWREFARASGLMFVPSPLRIFGIVDGVRITASAVATAGHEYGVEARAPFVPPLPAAFDVDPDFDRVEEAEATGDAAFDAAFCLTTDDPALIPRLDEATRGLLLLLRAEGSVEVHRDAVSYRSKTMGAPPSTILALRRIAAVSKRLASDDGPVPG